VEWKPETHELRKRHCLIIGLSSRGTQKSMGSPSGAIGTAVVCAFRCSWLRGVAEWVVGDAGSIGTRTDIQQANGFLLAQESVVARRDGG
jgi:hypothetical protein